MPGPFLGTEFAADYPAARAVVLPVPYEATVSYGGGTAAGPSAILEASCQVEVHDERQGGEPWREGIWTAPPLDLQDATPKTMSRLVQERVGTLLDDRKWVAMLGGEHSITPPAVAAARERFADLHVVQLDAHADLRESYEGEPLSHACAMARCLDHGVPVHAVGIRSYSPEEARRIGQGIRGYDIVHAWEMEGDSWADRALDSAEARPVYLTVDVDYFDPALVPATGTPEPGGGAWWPTLRFLDELSRRCRVVACDVVELAPSAELRHADFTVARLVYKLIGMALRG